MSARRLRIVGIHHVTVICRDVERSAGFYRNLLGMRLVKQAVNEDDASARHLFFGDEQGRPGTLVTCLEYPTLDEGRVGIGSTHHFALAVESDAELEAWRDYLRSRGVAARTCSTAPTRARSTCATPTGHIVELATLAPGVTVDEPFEELGRRPIRS
jgi:glyoxylase I family protein